MQAAKREAAVRGDHSPLRVLLVEDNEIDAMVARAAVEKAVRGPFKIQRATTLQESLVILGSGQVDLVLLDLNLPDSRGIDTLKSMGVATSCPIIVITAEERPGLDEEALGNGAFEILHKGRLGTDTIARLLRLAEDRRRTQGSLERARSRLELALAASRVCIWDYDLASGDVVLSESWAELIGAPPGETRTTIKALTELVHPNDFESLRRTLSDVAKGLCAEYAVEHRVCDRTGAWRWIVSRGKVIERDARGRALRVVGTNLDIGERKRAEQLLTLEHAVTHSLSESRDAAGAVRGAIQAICESEHWECCRYLWVDAAAGLLRAGEAWSVPDANIERYVEDSRAMVYAPGVGLVGKVWQSQEPLWVPDIANDPRVARPGLAQATGMRASLVVPVAAESRIIGVLIFHSRQVREPDPALLLKIRLIGGHIGQFVQRAQAEQAVRESEARFRSLTELSSDWYWEQDENFRFVAFSETPGSIGALRSAMIGKARWENSSILLSQEQWAAHRAVLEAHQPFRHFEYPFMHPDGDTTWSSISGEPVFGAEGRFKGYRGVGRDITERVRAEDDLRRFRLAMDNSADMIVLVDRATMRFVDVNSTVCRLLGYTREELLAKRPEELLPVSRAELEAAYDRQIADPSVLGGMTSYYRCRDGSRLPFESKRQVLRSGDKWLISVVSRDIRERIQADSALRESEQRFRGLTELSSDWYWEQDAELRFTYLSPRFSERTEGDPAKVLGRRRWEFDNVVPASDTWPEHRAVLEAHQPFRDFEQIRVRDDGTRQFFSSSGEPVFDAAGNFNGYRGVSSNITVRRSAEKRLVYLAQFDAVTGLPNRNLLEEKLGHAIVQSRRRGRGAGVLFIDLDRFKLVNDTLGHRAGDALLSQVGRSLRDCVRLDDTVGRLAGDEFAVVIADLARPEDAAFVAQKIVDSFAAPFDLDGQEIFLTASIGISTFPGDGDDGDTLLRCADAAMYRAKESSRNSFCFYTAEMNARTAAKLQLNNDLRRAVERKEFRLYYQPKVNLASGALTGMEALLRWQHPERGMVSPLDFIPALEDTGLIVAVGDWVVEEACRQLRDWTRDGLQPVPIAVNLSARQFRRRDLDAVIRGIVAAHGLQAGLLELEITESSLMADPKDAIRQLHALRAAGLRISVDDFGTGYSSLSYLTRLPLSTLKIDRSFVNAAITDPNSAAIVRMVIDMAQNLRFDVVAEGIETEAHVAFLRQHGCEQGQGYHFGRPAPADEVAVRLSRRA